MGCWFFWDLCSDCQGRGEKERETICQHRPQKAQGGGLERGQQLNKVPWGGNEQLHWRHICMCGRSCHAGRCYCDTVQVDGRAESGLEPSGGRTAVNRSQTSTGQWTVYIPQPLCLVILPFLKKQSLGSLREVSKEETAAVRRQLQSPSGLPCFSPCALQGILLPFLRERSGFYLCTEFFMSGLRSLSYVSPGKSIPPHPGNCSLRSSWRAVYQAAWPLSPVPRNFTL